MIVSEITWAYSNLNVNHRQDASVCNPQRRKFIPGWCKFAPNLFGSNPVHEGKPSTSSQSRLGVAWSGFVPRRQLEYEKLNKLIVIACQKRSIYRQ